jgi:hypothetical protein
MVLQTTGQSTTDPSTTGPSTTGPSTTGPSTTGPSTTGPSTTGPSTTGPSTTDPSTTGQSTTSSTASINTNPNSMSKNIPITTYGYNIPKNQSGSNPETEIYQHNFEGTSNVYSPAIYYNVESFDPLNLYDAKFAKYYKNIIKIL